MQLSKVDGQVGNLKKRSSAHPNVATRLRFTPLRASQLLAEGAPITYVAAQLGHASRPQFFSGMPAGYR